MRFGLVKASQRARLRLGRFDVRRGGCSGYDNQVCTRARNGRRRSSRHATERVKGRRERACQIWGGSEVKKWIARAGRRWSWRIRGRQADVRWGDARGRARARGVRSVRERESGESGRGVPERAGGGRRAERQLGAGSSRGCLGR